MAEGLSITIQLGAYQNIFAKAVAGHVADLRHALRALEDGSFVEKAQTAAPGAVVKLQFAEPETFTDDAVHRQTRRCFRSIIGDFITFLDQILAARRILGRRLVVPPDGLKDADAAIAFVQSALDAEYHSVASDASLRNPEKVRQLVQAGALSKESAMIIGTYFDVRRFMEHHRAIPPEPQIVFFRRMKMLMGDREIVSLPTIGEEGQAISVKMETEKRLLPAAEKISLTEAEINDVAFGLQLIAGEIVDTLNQSKN